MKLFMVNYIDDCDDDAYLTVGESLQEVEKRERSRLQTECSCLIGCWAYEVKEVDGYEIIVKQQEAFCD